MSRALLNAPLAAFTIFLLGIAAYGLAFAWLRQAITDDAWFAGVTLAYFIALRFAGRQAAARLASRASQTPADRH